MVSPPTLCVTQETVRRARRLSDKPRRAKLGGVMSADGAPLRISGWYGPVTRYTAFRTSMAAYAGQ